MQNCLAADLAERLGGGSGAAPGSRGRCGRVPIGFRLRFLVEVDGVTVMGAGTACGGGRLLRGDRRGETRETGMCPVVGVVVASGLGRRRGLSGGAARLRPARVGDESLGGGEAAGVGLLDSQLMICPLRTLPCSHMRKAMRCLTL